jgi:hypothetical protein
LRKSWSELRIFENVEMWKCGNVEMKREFENEINVKMNS